MLIAFYVTVDDWVADKVPIHARIYLRVHIIINLLLNFAGMCYLFVSVPTQKPLKKCILFE